MSSLKEIKGRIDSVKSTLKITSSMKIVSSAKLHKMQKVLEDINVYEERLFDILDTFLNEVIDKNTLNGPLMQTREVKSVAIVPFSSNFSLCGAFNANVAHKALEVIEEYRSKGFEDKDIKIFPVGSKAGDFLRKAGDLTFLNSDVLSENPTFGSADALAYNILNGFLNGNFDRVELVYNHFESMAYQPTVREIFLPFSCEGVSFCQENAYISEPNSVEILEKLLPECLKARFAKTVFDTKAAEHGARTFSMQLATDNGDDLLQDLTLEYNKGRQQKITNELLDLVGGAMK